MTRVPKGKSLQLVFEQIATKDSDSTLSLLDHQTVSQYHYQPASNGRAAIATAYSKTGIFALSSPKTRSPRREMASALSTR